MSTAQRPANVRQASINDFYNQFDKYLSDVRAHASYKLRDFVAEKRSVNVNATIADWNSTKLTLTPTRLVSSTLWSTNQRPPLIPPQSALEGSHISLDELAEQLASPASPSSNLPSLTTPAGLTRRTAPAGTRTTARMSTTKTCISRRTGVRKSRLLRGARLRQ